MTRVLLLNHRADVRFEFVKDFFGVPTTLGESKVIKMRNKDAPLYVHLALTGTPKSIFFSCSKDCS